MHFIYPYHISYVCLWLVKRNLSSVDFLTSKCKAEVNTKLSPRIMRLEIQGSCCSSAGCGSIHKHSWSALVEADVSPGSECQDLLCVYVCVCVCFVCVYLPFSHCSASWVVAACMNCLPRETISSSKFLDLFRYQKPSPPKIVFFHCTYFFLLPWLRWKLHNHRAD